MEEKIRIVISFCPMILRVPAAAVLRGLQGTISELAF